MNHIIYFWRTFIEDLFLFSTSTPAFHSTSAYLSVSDPSCLTKQITLLLHLLTWFCWVPGSTAPETWLRNSGFRKLIAFLSVLKQGLDVVRQCRITPAQGALSPEDSYRLERQVVLTWLKLLWVHLPHSRSMSLPPLDMFISRPVLHLTFQFDWLNHVALKSTTFQTLLPKECRLNEG